MRGVIMETKNGRAVLLTKDGEFVNIKNKGYSIGDKVNITSNTGRLCAMAASLVIVCAGMGSYFVPAGYVSVDINPSLMMTLNLYNRVIDVKTFNDDAQVLLNGTNIKGKGAEESVEMLIKASEEIGYINDNNRDVILDVVPGIKKPNMDGIKHENIEITIETADRKTLRTAQDMGVSIAKAKAIEEYTEKNGGDVRSNAAKFNDKSVKEIRNIIIDGGKSSDVKPSDTPKSQKNENILERDDKILQSKSPQISASAKEKMPADSKPIKMEQKLQNNISNQESVSKPQNEASKPSEPTRGDNNNSENQSQTPEKKPDNSGKKGKEDLTDNSPAEKKPNISEPTADKIENNPSKKDAQEHENVPQSDNIQPSITKHEEIQPQNNSQTKENDKSEPHENTQGSKESPMQDKSPQNEAPKQNEQQNNEGKPSSDENADEHDERKEDPTQDKSPQNKQPKENEQQNNGGKPASDENAKSPNNPQPSKENGKPSQSEPHQNTQSSKESSMQDKSLQKEAPKQSEQQSNGGKPSSDKDTDERGEHK